MSWWSIEVRAPAEHKETVGAWLVARTGHAVEEREDHTLIAFATDEQAASRLVAELGAETTGRVALGPRLVESVDWSLHWREGLGIRRLGRVSIIPSWLPESANPGAWGVVLDPETAFGSGEHGSTRVALILLDRLLRADDLVLDLGSGSGILAIAAAKLGAARVTGIELDPEAVRVAERNATRNRVSERVEFLEGDAGALAPLLGPGDLVLSNILRSVNVTLLPKVAAGLKAGGVAIFSGMEEAEAADFLAALDQARFSPVEEAIDDGWWGVATRRAE